MSRIGKRPIPVPNKVTVAIDGQHISVKGAKGSLERVIPSGVKVEQEENILTVTPVNDSRTSRERHGLVRTQLRVQGLDGGNACRVAHELEHCALDADAGQLPTCSHQPQKVVPRRRRCQSKTYLVGGAGLHR